VRRYEIGALQAVAGFAAIKDALTFLPTDHLAARALDIALAITHPVYDCLYLALAESTGLQILTADRKLIVNCQGTPYGDWLVSLEDASSAG